MGVDRPDWERYQVRSRAVDNTGESHTPLGDPTRWGGDYDVTIRGGGLTAQVQSGQIARIQCTDAYSRAWLLAGTVAAAPGTWAVADADWLAQLEISFGVGQAVVVHLFDMRALCQLALDSLVYLPRSLGALEVRPFVISGGLFGQQVSARVLHSLVGFEADERFITTLAFAPLNAGTGL
jgi:hypothetical protein